jgi:hypothetical protein
VLLCVVGTRGREPPFIGGEEGALWKMLPPHIEGTKPTSTCIEPGQPSALTLGMAISCNRPKLGPNGASWGAAAPAPWLGRLGTAFAWWSAGWVWSVATVDGSYCSF